jgi:hypothetical protein
MLLTPQQWRRAENLFCEALELPAAQRGAFLLQTCPDDTALREEVVTLLATAESGNNILSQPVRVVGRSGVDAGAARDRLWRAIELFQAREGSASLYHALAHILLARLLKPGSVRR